MNWINIINKEQQTISGEIITAHMRVDVKFGVSALFVIHLSRSDFSPHSHTLGGLE